MGVEQLKKCYEKRQTKNQLLNMDNYRLDKESKYCQLRSSDL